MRRRPALLLLALLGAAVFGILNRSESEAPAPPPGRDLDGASGSPESAVADPVKADVQRSVVVRDEAGVSAVEPDGPAAEIPAQLAVTVTLAGSQTPIPSARVTVALKDGRRTEAHTDAGGVAELEVPEGILTDVWVGATDRSVSGHLPVLKELAAGRELRLAVEVDAGVFVGGRVERITGEPVPGASVSAWHAAWPRSKPVREATADSTGRFRIGPFDDRVLLGAVAPGLVTRHTLQVDPTVAVKDDLVISMVPSVVLRGTVIDAEGPVAGATVEVRRRERRPLEKGTRQGGPMELSATTGADGRFTLDTAGVAYEFEVQHEEYLWWRGEHDPADGELVVTLNRGASLAGVVRDAAGTPIAGARVRPWAQGRPYIDDVSTGADGAFRFAGLDAGAPAALFVRADGFVEYLTEDFRFAPGENRRDIVLERAGEVTGTVLGTDGSVVTEASVMIGKGAAVDAYDWEEDEVWVDEQGRFRFTRVPLYEPRFVVAYHWERAWCRSAAVQVRAGEDVTLRLDDVSFRGVAFVGTVSDAVTGAGLERFSVTVLIDGGGRQVEFYGGVYDRAGFSPNRRLALTFNADGYTERSIDEAVYPIGDHRFDVRLYPQRAVTFRLVTPDGAPAPDAALQCIDIDDHPVIMRTGAASGSDVLHANAEGLVEARGFPGGPCSIVVMPYLWGPERRYSFDFTATPSGVQEVIVEPVEWMERTIRVLGTDGRIESVWIRVKNGESTVRSIGLRRDGDGYLWTMGDSSGPAEGPVVTLKLPRIPLRVVVSVQGRPDVEVPLADKDGVETVVELP